MNGEAPCFIPTGEERLWPGAQNDAPCFVPDPKAPAAPRPERENKPYAGEKMAVKLQEVKWEKARRDRIRKKISAGVKAANARKAAAANGSAADQQDGE
jgi:hypothetical protein